MIDVVPGDLVSSVILATAAAATQQPDSLSSSPEAPPIVHACTSTSCPLAITELMSAGDFWSSYKPTFQLPLTVLPTVTPEYVPNK